MKPVTGIITAAALAAAVAGCSSETYYGPDYGYAYRPGYAYSTPSYYNQSTAYGYSYPQYSQRRAYRGYWDYQRNYRGIHSSPEFSSM
jgi:hypothetical protein